ncbi:hypothetical protein KUTeg_018071 [Tegillarca granosa]|uniref:Uncharacterized protein n=1 Tax=Tegillarca granosa TaxID=220873 RepID=A0ABQ9EGT5_TEGGR|nr:hypothetical protein KUTeg_018071 [Tegillarca granosa]
MLNIETRKTHGFFRNTTHLNGNLQVKPYCLKMATLFVTCLLVCLFCAYTTLAVNPGIKARVTTGAVNQVNQIALNLLVSKIQGSRVDDQKGKAHHVHYELSNLMVTRFVKPQASVTFAPSKGKVISDHGHFDVKVLRISFSLTIGIGADANGKPTITTSGCSTGIGSVHLNIHGGKSKYLNLFKSTVESNIKHSLQKKLCDTINGEVNTNAKAILSKLSVSYDFLGNFTFDYRLLSKPAIQKNYVEFYNKGEVFWKQDKSEAPFQAPVMPSLNATNKMVYVVMTDYSFKTFAYQAQKHGYFTYNVSAQNVPVEDRSYFNTTCKGGKCIGTLIPQIAKRYPNQQVSLQLSMSSIPNISINGQLQVSCQGQVSMYVQNSVHLLTLNSTITLAGNFSISKQKIFATVEKTTVKSKVSNSSIGTINALTLLLIDTTVNGLMKTELKGRNNICNRHFVQGQKHIFEEHSTDFAKRQGETLLITAGKDIE